jgi:2-C-methyl-D-erythritol 4-phosphate cytidylyltransferase
LLKLHCSLLANCSHHNVTIADNAAFLKKILEVIIIDNIILLIPCAGYGRRFHAHLPKQYTVLAGKTILTWTLGRFLDIKDIVKIVLIAQQTDIMIDSYKQLSDKICIAKVGGESRMESVFHGLCTLHNCQEHDWIMVHDSVRCCIDTTQVLDFIKQLAFHPVGGILATKLTDSLKRVNLSQPNSWVVDTVSAKDLYLAQTPQMFRYGILKQAFYSAERVGALSTLRDEASVMSEYGVHTYNYQLIQGNQANIKITHPEDKHFAELLLTNPAHR